jgi:hypothetical protein
MDAVKLSFWMGAVIIAALGLVRMVRPRQSRTERAVRLGKRILRNIRITGMLNIPPRYMAGFGRRVLRRMAR